MKQDLEGFKSCIFWIVISLRFSASIDAIEFFFLQGLVHHLQIDHISITSFCC